MGRVAVLAACALVAFSAPAWADLAPLPAQSPEAPWPTLEWAEDRLAEDVDRAGLEREADAAFAGRHPDYGETRALLAVQGGRIVYERYGRGYGAGDRLISWSMAKSITHALVGAAVLQGKVNIDAPMGSPHWRANDPRAAITWRQWLSMVDGQSWIEVDAPSVTANDSARMLYGEGRGDIARFAAHRKLIHAPGTHWNYNSGATVLIADALTRVIAPDPTGVADRRARMRAWMDEALFAPIGMHPIVEFDPQGLYYGSALMHATARDYARFGLLYLRDGVWEGARILPGGWVDFARTRGPDGDVYGAHWWLTPEEGSGTPMRATIVDNSLSDAFSAEGHEGQIILVVPSKDLVLVRLGRFEDTRARWNALGDWMGRVTRCFADRPAVISVSQGARPGRR